MEIKRIFIFLLVILLLGLLSIYYPYLTGEIVENTKGEYELESAFVVRVIDGDTVEAEINNSVYSIRLLGINTPEKNKDYYDEAKDFLRQIENKSVEILRDSEDSDKYDRKLRYVFYENRIMNVEILEKGLGTSFMVDGLKYKDKLINAEEFAKNNKIKLWGKSNNVCADCIKLAKLDYQEEFFILENICNFDCNLQGWIVKDDANHFFKLNNLNSNTNEKYDSKTSVWNDAGDRFFMRDEQGRLVVFYEYRCC